MATAVCSTRNIELVRALGAHEVIDNTNTDFVSGGARYDVMLDMVGNRSLTQCKSVLKRGGRYVPCSLGQGDWVAPFTRIIKGVITFLWSGREFQMFVQRLASADLVAMRELIEANSIRPVVEQIWQFQDAAEAFEHVGIGHSRGLQVVHVQD